MRPLEVIGSDGDAVALRRAFGCFPTGVAAVCARMAGAPVGMAVSSFTSVSLTPPLVSICIDRNSTTWPILRTAPTLGVSVLAAEHGTAGRQLAVRNADRFAGLQTTTTPSGALHLQDAAAVFECAVHEEIVAGDHGIVLLLVLAFAARPATHPLVFHGSRFRTLGPWPDELT